MFKTRVISSVFLIILMLIMNFAGGAVMDVIIFFIALQGLFEFYRAVGVHKEADKRVYNSLEIIGYVYVPIYYLVGYFCVESRLLFQLLIIVCAFISMLGAYVFKFEQLHSDLVMKAFFGFIYVPVMLQFLYMTRDLDGGACYIWLIYIASWLCDTCAYLTGMTLGKHKLAPVLSPKKSIEGSIGGIVGATLVAIFYAILLNKYFGRNESMLSFAIIGAVGAVVSQIGDLAASAFKRNNDIKDYGKLIPGHGGVLDRFDSVIFTSPMIYFLSAILMNR